MRRFFLLTVSVFFSAITSGQTIEQSNYNIVLKTGLFAPFLNTVSFGIERVIDENSSFQGQLIVNWEGPDFGIYRAKPAEELIEAMSSEFIG